jgi:hypothetical protein
MSKRKRASTGKTPAGADQKPAAEDSSASADDAAVKEDMAHVSPDILAGSPDIFASKPAAAAPEPEASTETEPEPPMEPPTEASTEDAPSAISEAAAVTEPAETTPQAPPDSSSLAPPPPMPEATYPMGTVAAPAARPPRGGSSTALGIVLVVVGLFALGVVVFGIDLTSYGWPLFVIIPGLTLLVVGFLGAGPGASIPGGILTMLGLVLSYQSGTGDWPSWAFAWALVAPFGVGLGMYLQALRDRDHAALRRGRNLMFAGAIIFMIGFVFFESILGISGTDYGIFGKAALPALLIVIGIILLVRSLQRGRRV